jgi:glyoxalase family protein
VTLWLAEVERTSELIRNALGYKLTDQQGNRYRYQTGAKEAGPILDILHRPGYPRGHFGAGSIHHIAFRAKDDHQQSEYLVDLRRRGQRVTPVKDRQYFHSIYFRSPGGVLFEIATDNPGFTIDEPVSALGNNLKLPPWYENIRPQIENQLPPIEHKPLQKSVFAEVSGD